MTREDAGRGAAGARVWTEAIAALSRERVGPEQAVNEAITEIKQILSA
jgi:hypothetical protein